MLILCYQHCSGERVLCFHGPLLYEAKVGFLLHAVSLVM